MTSPDVGRRRFLQVGLLAPIPVVLLGVVAQLVASPQLPDPVAVHWGISGQPDGFARRGPIRSSRSCSASASRL